MSHPEWDPIFNDAHAGISRAWVDYKVQTEHYANTVRDAAAETDITDLQRVVYGLSASTSLLEEWTEFEARLAGQVGQPVAFSQIESCRLDRAGIIAEPKLRAAFANEERTMGYLAIGLRQITAITGATNGDTQPLQEDGELTLAVITRTGRASDALECDLEIPAQAIGVRISQRHKALAIGLPAIREEFVGYEALKVTRWYNSVRQTK